MDRLLVVMHFSRLYFKSDNSDQSVQSYQI